MNASLASTPFIDFDHPAVAAFAHANCGPSNDGRKRAIGLYYAVRDQIRYDAYGIEVSLEKLCASHVLTTARGWCLNKAILLAAACRCLGIPARLGYADVRNHLSTERLRQAMKTDIFYYHGYTAIWLDDKWIKATPAFNVGLCHKFDLLPLEFDGYEDSIYHPYDKHGNRHMEYLKFHGEFDDVPLKQIQAIFKTHYPNMNEFKDADFDEDVEKEAPFGQGTLPEMN